MGKKQKKRKIKKNKKIIKIPLTFPVGSCTISLALNKWSSERKQNHPRRYALLAQLVEHLTLNQGVQGSSP